MEADLAFLQGKLALLGKRATGTQRFHRGSDDGTYTTRTGATRETPSRGRARDQPEACEGQAGRGGESDGLIVLGKPGNAGGGKEPSFKSMWKVVKEGRLGNLETPSSVRKLQTALHAKAKAEPEYRFYLLYDKVYRADVLSFAYARCKANGGAAGVDGQTFDDIEAYGGQDRESEDRKIPDIETDWNPWLGELAQELRDDALSREAGETTQLQTERMGELLPSRAGLQGLPGGRCPYQPSAAPVVMQEASGQRKGDHSLPRPVPLRHPEAGPIAGADAQPAVGEGMSACP